MGLSEDLGLALERAEVGDRVGPGTSFFDTGFLGCLEILGSGEKNRKERFEDWFEWVEKISHLAEQWRQKS